MSANKTALCLDGLYFSEDGNYGGGSMVIFGHDDLTEQQQETLSNLSDNDRYDYALAIAKGQDLSEWESTDEI